MKRLISILLAMILLLAAIPALAEKGDAIIARNGADGFDDYARSVCVVGNKVWVEGNDTVYVYDTDTGDMAAYPWDDDVRAAMKGETRDESGAQLFAYVCAWFSDEGEARVLLNKYSFGGDNNGTYDMTFARVVIKDGKASLEELGAADWKKLEDELGGSINLSNAVVLNDTLCAIAQGMDGENVVFMPLDGSATRSVYLGNAWVSGMTAWNGDLMLIENDENAQCALLPFDGDEVGAWQQLPEDETQAGGVSGAVQYGDELIYLAGNALMAFNPDTGDARTIVNIPVETWGMQAFVTESGLYVTGGSSGVVLRALNRSGEAAETLTVNDPDNSGAAENAIVSFMNATGAEVVSVQRDGVLDALLTKSTADDVLLLSTNYNGSDIQAILSRGWARPIESETLAEYISGMYPALSELLVKDGQVLGVPVDMNVTVPGVSVGALKALGLTIDDVPTSWPELIDWLNGLISTATVPLVDDYGDAESLRASFVRCIVNTCRLDIDAGALDGWDTPELRAALEAVERLDAEALSAQSAYDDDEDEVVNPLFTMYTQGGVNDDTYQDEYREIPLYMSLTAETTHRVPLDGCVAIINPYSEHIELATRFLETLAKRDTQASRAMLRPDLNEAVRSSDYERYTREYDDKIARLEDELKTAEGDVKTSLEAELESTRQTREHMENYYWIVSAESIARYRANDAGVTLNLKSRDYSYYDDVDQYASGEMDMDAFIAALQKKLEMQRLEQQ